MGHRKMSRFARFAWFVLAYNIAVVIWGAYVRASKAGAGCGDHWPDCNGQIIPLAGTLKTLVEFTHRATSGIAGLLVVAIVILAFRRFSKGHVVRAMTVAALAFMVIEASIGALLVKKGLVVDNDTVARALVIATHLVNTLLLLAALTLTAWWSTSEREPGLPVAWKGNQKAASILGILLAAIVFLNASGAITALGATLFPVTSFAEGLARGMSPRHFLEGLIWIHPLSAVITVLAGTFGVVLVGYVRQKPVIARLTRYLVSLFVLQMVLGGLNLFLHAPTWLQLIHLLTADLIWVNLVIFTAEICARKDISEAATGSAPASKD